MTVREALAAVKTLKPVNYDDQTLLRWLNELSARAWEDVLSRYGEPEHPGPPVLTLNEPEAALPIPYPHDDVYLKWLFAQIDFHNGEYDRYNNSTVVFNAGFQAFGDSWNRTHMPRQDKVIQI